MVQNYNEQFYQRVRDVHTSIQTLILAGGQIQLDSLQYYNRVLPHVILNKVHIYATELQLVTANNNVKQYITETFTNVECNDILTSNVPGIERCKCKVFRLPWPPRGGVPVA